MYEQGQLQRAWRALVAADVPEEQLEAALDVVHSGTSLVLGKKVGDFCPGFTVKGERCRKKIAASPTGLCTGSCDS